MIIDSTTLGLRGKPKKVKRLTEQTLRKIIRDVLMEMWSAFPNQYEIARIVTDTIQQMIENRERERKMLKKLLVFLLNPLREYPFLQVGDESQYYFL